MTALARLTEAGFEVEVRQQHLLVHSIPYVTSTRRVERGTLICTYMENAGAELPPDNHQVWWTGEYPCFSSGSPIVQIENENGERELFPGCFIRHRFSNKPEGVPGFADHYSKVVHYVSLLQNQAKALDSAMDARTRRSIPQEPRHSPFWYDDTASARAEIQLTSSRLTLGAIAIIGLGGTGSYILDQIAKTPVSVIHLYDGDVFLQHNAFRSPGAATLEELAEQMPKVEYFGKKYSAMHRGVVRHPYYIDGSNVNELDQIDFAFICVDQGGVRAMLMNHLRNIGVPFIDVGMNLRMVLSNSSLVGSCRSTLSTPQRSDHLDQYAPVDLDEEDALYRQNVQVADMNALNAQLAVMQWKQYFGFYQDDFHVHNLTFAVNSMSLVRDAIGKSGT
jgi:hypothetical protein